MYVAVQLLSRVQLFVTPWTAAHQASLYFPISGSLLKLLSFEPVMPSSHLILCRPLLFLLSVFPSISVFPNESCYTTPVTQHLSLRSQSSPFLVLSYLLLKSLKSLQF